MTLDPFLIARAAQYVVQLRDAESGGFVFAKGNKPTLMGTAYAVHALEFLGALDLLSEKEKSAAAGFLMRGCREDGSFRDPLFEPSSIATKQHDESYFDGETTCFVQNALDAIGAPPPPRRVFSKEVLTEKGLRTEFNSYDWHDPHLNSNRVMFWMAQFAHEVERHGRKDLLRLIDVGLDWMDENQSPETGLWAGPVSVGLSVAMAATFHYTFFYSYRNRPLLFLERIIDSCLELQRDDGLFSRNGDVGQTCLDYDALDLLAKASLITDYRLSDVEKAFDRARLALLTLLNDDGGFANVKERRKGNNRVPGNGFYHTGLEICSCDNIESNSFSTWFRLLAYALCFQQKGASLPEKHPVCFRRLPWLGYHDVKSIKASYENKGHQSKAVFLTRCTGKGKTKWVGKGFDRNLDKNGDSYVFYLPDDLRHFALKIKLSSLHPLQVRVAYCLKEEKHIIGDHILNQKVNPGENLLFFLLGNEEIKKNIFLDFIGKDIVSHIDTFLIYEIN
ncbi:MAG: terpene cyclase/mutase family protein [Deltaproteobacteria bacterium]|nr:terpene cyclase/mutase family protein [Deltaproteobacteria bacterium]